MKVKTKYFIPFLLCLLGSMQMTSQNLVYAETFGECEIPASWENEILDGGVGFISQEVIRNDPDYGDNCILYFLDNKRQGKGDTSVLVLRSPWMTPLNGPEFFIDYKLNFIKTNGKPQILEVYYEINGQEFLFEKHDSSIWGATFNDFVDKTIVIDNQNNSPVRLVIKYNNYGEANGTISFDNVIFRGYPNDVCENAVRLEMKSDFCFEGNNLGLYDGTLSASCNGIQTSRPTWYEFIAPANGFMKVSTNAQFNDVLDVFYGRCGDLIPFRCTNRDEFGFLGEDLYVPVTIGNAYYIRITGYNEPFSHFIGSYCLSLESINELPNIPNYDFCSGALEVTLDNDCIEATNRLMGIDQPIPSLNLKSKADIWFKYTHSTDDAISIFTNADFADVITIYSGNCLFLNEVTGTDQGPNFENIELKKDMEYYIQVSGYFSTLEGDLCMEIVTVNNDPPANDECVGALALKINDNNCQPASTLLASSSGLKTSCQIKSGPDIWYQFSPGSSGKFFMEVNADFIYDIGLYYGECDSLIELKCDFNPHRCEGYVEWENLIDTVNYYIQITAHNGNSGIIRGDVCLAIYEDGMEPDFQQLTINAEIECIGGDFGILHVSTDGGNGTLSTYGNKEGDLLRFGETFEIILDDEANCRVIIDGSARCKEEIDCENNDLDLVVSLDCELDRFGLQTGRVEVNYTYTGGMGQVDSYGLTNGDYVDSGDKILVVISDESGCLKYYEAINDCQPFTCSESKLKITVDVNCVDRLFKAELIVSAADGNGNYSFSGDINGTLLNNGDQYITSVTDETGCTDSISGLINCNFDSCVFSGLKLSVDFECVQDSLGRNTGKAVLRVSTKGGIGQLTFLGGNDGDTLSHGDIYTIVLKDEWGCEEIVQGVVVCTPNSSKDLSLYGIQKIFPNPTMDWVMLEYNSIKSGNLSIQIISDEGRVVQKSKASIISGTNHIPIVFNEIPTGIYFIRTIMDDQIATHRIAITL